MPTSSPRQRRASTSWACVKAHSSLDFEIRAFVDSLDKRLRVRHAVHLAAWQALHDNGIACRTSGRT
ncbi:hypothetical protein [Sphaerotilus microaerophilus]|uniref:hypothetical protein n=1 Tax=Burkholderiales TaxID=80840 RepID=UPI003D178FE1